MISLFALFDEYTRMVCFNITIYDDPFFELEEEFSLSANVSDLVPVTIKPNISVITIVDNDSKSVLPYTQMTKIYPNSGYSQLYIGCTYKVTLNLACTVRLP